MGLMQRVKGRAYEQKIARILRSHWPDADIRRASQADRACQSDVYCTGGPAILSRLWLELHDAAQPNALKKLQQAETDCWCIAKRLQHPERWRLPVVIWHRIREQSHQVTMRLRTLDGIRGGDLGGGIDSVVTMDIEDFLGILHVFHDHKGEVVQ